jgi:FKBP-type peptidyl-prolyl cis-trans isomerase (trigger factor)
MAAATNNAKAVGIMLDSANFNDYSLAKALDMAVQSKAEDATDVLLATYQFTSKQLLRLTEEAIHMGLNRMAKNLHTAAYTAIISQNRTERQAKDESYRLSKENEKRGTFIRV